MLDFFGYASSDTFDRASARTSSSALSPSLPPRILNEAVERIVAFGTKAIPWPITSLKLCSVAEVDHDVAGAACLRSTHLIRERSCHPHLPVALPSVVGHRRLDAVRDDANVDRPLVARSHLGRKRPAKEARLFRSLG